MKEQKFIIDEVKKALAGEREKEQIPSYRRGAGNADVRRVYTPLLRIYNGRNEIPGKRRRDVYLLRRVGRVL